MKLNINELTEVNLLLAEFQKSEDIPELLPKYDKLSKKQKEYFKSKVDWNLKSFQPELRHRAELIYSALYI